MKGLFVVFSAVLSWIYGPVALALIFLPFLFFFSLFQLLFVRCQLLDKEFIHIHASSCQLAAGCSWRWWVWPPHLPLLPLSSSSFTPPVLLISVSLLLFYLLHKPWRLAASSLKLTSRASQVKCLSGVVYSFSAPCLIDCGQGSKQELYWVCTCFFFFFFVL